MATVTYPSAKFPAPALAFSGKTSQNTRRTKMDSGRTRQVRQFTTEVRTYSAKWELNNAQFEAFQAWVKYKLHNGADWFNIALPVGNVSGNTLKTVEARLVNGDYTFTHKPVLNWSVAATLEVEDAALMSEAALDSWLAS